ncbi:unnamed protein product [Closterium sp. Yama58-4]|nr:unnamed protein product [Closterium sp. Yama58-4]
MREVCDGVFIGNLADATSVRMLERAHIMRLVSLCPMARSSFVTVTPPPSDPESTPNPAETPADTSAKAGGVECDSVTRGCDGRGRQRLTVDLLDMDDADLLAVLPSCLAFVEESVSCGEKVLVHCHAGVSRSAAVVTAYLMKLHKSTAEVQAPPRMPQQRLSTSAAHIPQHGVGSQPPPLRLLALQAAAHGSPNHQHTAPGRAHWGQ